MTREKYTQITVPLSRDEFTALRETADVAYRHPRDQARYILRQALGLADDEPTLHRIENGAADSQETAVIAT